MIRPILACADPYEAAKEFTAAGWRLDFSQPPESGDPLVGVSLCGSQVLLGVTEGYVAADELAHIGCGVELCVTVPSGQIRRIYEEHRGLGPTELAVQPWGDTAFEVEIGGYRFMISAARPEGKPSGLELRPNEMQRAVALMREVAAWGREKGYRVWPDEWLMPESLLNPDVRPEDFYIGSIGGEAACAFILQWADPDNWPGAPKYEAAYLHKFCVRRKFAGMGMTKRAADAIGEECRARGVRYIRLDTALDEKTVRKIYLDAGFKIVDIIDCPNGRSLALYELEV